VTYECTAQPPAVGWLLSDEHGLPPDPFGDPCIYYVEILDFEYAIKSSSVKPAVFQWPTRGALAGAFEGYPICLDPLMPAGQVGSTSYFFRGQGENGKTSLPYGGVGGFRGFPSYAADRPNRTQAVAQFSGGRVPQIVRATIGGGAVRWQNKGSTSSTPALAIGAPIRVLTGPAAGNYALTAAPAVTAAGADFVLQCGAPSSSECLVAIPGYNSGTQPPQGTYNLRRTVNARQMLPCWLDEAATYNFWQSSTASDGTGFVDDVNNYTWDASQFGLISAANTVDAAPGGYNEYWLAPSQVERHILTGYYRMTDAAQTGYSPPSSSGLDPLSAVIYKAEIPASTLATAWAAASGASEYVLLGWPGEPGLYDSNQGIANRTTYALRRSNPRYWKDDGAIAADLSSQSWWNYLPLDPRGNTAIHDARTGISGARPLGRVGWECAGYVL
jgi:hypothetical protein